MLPQPDGDQGGGGDQLGALDRVAEAVGRRNYPLLNSKLTLSRGRSWALALKINKLYYEKCILLHFLLREIDTGVGHFNSSCPEMGLFL